ncbi:MAG TPA: RNA polymerase sigma-54 factor, partial [bacterium]|nr:RNA polymerase sigma-54 factor [bacterium]
MALEIKQNLKLSQSLVITPQLQQAIKLLQLSQMELVEMVQNEMLENPLLEEGMEEPAKESAEAQAERQEMEVQPDSAPQAESQEVGGKEGDFKQEAPDFDWDNYLNTYNAPENIQSHIDELPSYENTLASKTSLFDHLMWQLQLSNFGNEDNNIGTMILGCIDDDGYLKDPLEDIAAKCESTPEAVETVLKKIQEFDPPGVAARDLKECLMAQVRHLGPEKELVARIIDNHLSNLE